MKFQIVLAVLILHNFSPIKTEDSAETDEALPSDDAVPVEPMEKPHSDIEYDENSGSTINTKECSIDPPPTLDEIANYYNWMDDQHVQWANARERLCKTVRVVHNNRKIEAHNKLYEEGKVSYKMHIWRESHLTHEEKREKYQIHTVEAAPEWRALPQVNVAALPAPRAAVDWRVNGYVSTPVDQGGCGSCYAWAAVGALEGQVRKCGITNETLSVQSIVDCATVGVWGCSSGWPK
jgi:C1A family cysteine protease